TGHPDVYNVGPVQGDRHSQYDLWRPNPVADPQQFRGKTFIIVNAAPAVLAGFAKTDAVREVIYSEDGNPVARWILHVCRDFRAFPRPQLNPSAYCPFPRLPFPARPGRAFCHPAGRDLQLRHPGTPSTEGKMSLLYYCGQCGKAIDWTNVPPPWCPACGADFKPGGVEPPPRPSPGASTDIRPKADLKPRAAETPSPRPTPSPVPPPPSQPEKPASPRPTRILGVHLWPTDKVQ